MAESPASIDVAELAIDGSLDGFGRARPAFWGVQSQAFTGRNVATFAAMQGKSHSGSGILARCWLFTFAGQIENLVLSTCSK
jgi:hypothetical protein